MPHGAEAPLWPLYSLKVAITSLSHPDPRSFNGTPPSPLFSQGHQKVSLHPEFNRRLHGISSETLRTSKLQALCKKNTPKRATRDPSLMARPTLPGWASRLGTDQSVTKQKPKSGCPNHPRLFPCDLAFCPGGPEAAQELSMSTLAQTPESHTPQLRYRPCYAMLGPGVQAN